MTLGRIREPTKLKKNSDQLNNVYVHVHVHVYRKIDSYSHFVTMPSRHTRLPRKRAESERGVTCLAPKLPSNPTKKSSNCLPYTLSTVITNSLTARWWKNTCTYTWLNMIHVVMYKWICTRFYMNTCTCIWVYTNTCTFIVTKLLDQNDQDKHVL